MCFIRDIPAPSPRGFRPAGALLSAPSAAGATASHEPSWKLPTGALAAAVDPELRTFSPGKLAGAPPTRALRAVAVGTPPGASPSEDAETRGIDPVLAPPGMVPQQR